MLSSRTCPTPQQPPPRLVAEDEAPKLLFTGVKCLVAWPIGIHGLWVGWKFWSRSLLSLRLWIENSWIHRFLSTSAPVAWMRTQRRAFAEHKIFVRKAKWAVREEHGSPELYKVKARHWEKKHSDIVLRDINQGVRFLTTSASTSETYGQMKLKDTEWVCMHNWNRKNSFIKKIMQDIAKKVEIREEFVARNILSKTSDNWWFCQKKKVLRPWVNCCFQRTFPIDTLVNLSPRTFPLCDSGLWYTKVWETTRSVWKTACSRWSSLNNLQHVKELGIFLSGIETWNWRTTNCAHDLWVHPCNRSLWSNTGTLKFVRHKSTERRCSKHRRQMEFKHDY